jgi:DNA (cytosine-5)-methyltransferase 1
VVRIGSLFAGLGGLDLAAEWALGARTAWQADLIGHEVRARHWPGAAQLAGDVRELTPPACDVLVGGFPCQDLSVAGSGAGLDGAQSGLYRELVRIALLTRPDVLVIENVPAVLGYRERIEEDLAPWGLTWVRCRAADAGAPHLRARVFVVGVRGGRSGGVIDADRSWEWRGDRVWPSPTANNAQAGGSEGYSTESGRHTGTTLVDAVRPWPTPTATNPAGSRPVSEPLGMSVRPWSTPTTRDHKDGGEGVDHRKVEDRGKLTGQAVAADRAGYRLSPAWVETLMGLPTGWTRPDGPPLHAEPYPRWPRGRYPASWDRSVVWPGYDWEPERTESGPPVKGRPARLRALGNAVVPQAGALAIRCAIDGGGQGRLW